MASKPTYQGSIPWPGALNRCFLVLVPTYSKNGSATPLVILAPKSSEWFYSVKVNTLACHASSEGSSPSRTATTVGILLEDG